MATAKKSQLIITMNRKIGATRAHLTRARNEIERLEAKNLLLAQRCGRLYRELRKLKGAA